MIELDHHHHQPVTLLLDINHYQVLPRYTILPLCHPVVDSELLLKIISPWGAIEAMKLSQ